MWGDCCSGVVFAAWNIEGVWLRSSREGLCVEVVGVQAGMFVVKLGCCKNGR